MIKHLRYGSRSSSLGILCVALLAAQPARLMAAIKIACIGDSITVGYGYASSNSYPSQLGRLLGANYTVSNYGVSGTTMLKLGDSPYWNTSAYTSSGNSSPDIVLIMLGTNDSKSTNWVHSTNFISDYSAMIDHYRNLPSHPLVYINTCPTAYKTGTGITDDIISGVMLQMIRQIGTNKNCTVIDVNAATKNMPENFPDKIHPNETGSAIIAQTVFNALTSVSLTNTDANGTSSFNAAGYWTSGQAPSAANNYLDTGFVLRTPGSANDYTFAGHSLTLSLGGILAVKNDGHTTTIGINALTGLFLNDASIQIFDANVSDTVAGYLTLLSRGGGFSPDNGTLTISAIISGSGSLNVNNAGIIILSGTNSYTGATILNAAATLTFSAGASGASSSLQLTNGSLCQVLTTLPVLSSNAFVSINTGGKLYLTNSVNLSVSDLLLNGVVQTNGTWGSSSSAAAHQNDIYFGGAGVLTVNNVGGGSVNPTNLFWTGSGTATFPGNGTWNTTAGNNIWNNGIGTTGNTSWSSAASATNAVFGGADGTYGITVGANVSAKRLLFQNNGYTLLNTAAKTVSFSATGSAADPNIVVAAGETATIGTNVTVTQPSSGGGNAAYCGGAGTLIIDNGGTISQQRPSSFGIVGSLTVSIKNGGTFKMTDASSSTVGNLQLGAANGDDSTLSVDGGTISFAGTNNQGVLVGAAAGATGTLTINSGTVSQAAAATKVLSVGGASGGTGTVDLNGGLLLVTRVNMISGATGTFNFNGGTLKPINSTFASTFMAGLTAANVCDGGAVIDDGGFAITIGQPLLHSLIDSPTDGGLTKLGTGTLALTGANTYNGSTTINEGTLALGGNGSIGGSVVIATTGGTTLDVSARTDQTLTLNNGQTLTGSGSLKGKLVVSSGGTVNPGDTIGTLTVQSNIVLNGLVVLELNRTNAPTSDELASTAGSITGGGTLTVINLGPALQTGDTFQLFSQAVSGFATVNLPAGYVWANNLGSNGTIQVMAVVSTNQPNITLQATLNSLALSWPFDHTSWRLQTATNLFGSNWADVTGSTATNSMLIFIYPTNANLFFRLVYP